MEPKSPPTLASILPTSLVLILLGGTGLYLVIYRTAPSGGTRWAMYFTAVVLITGLFLPVTAFLNRRFPSTPPATSIIALRQAIWIGIYIPTLVWLQIGQALTLSLVLLLAIGLILIEWLLRLRERSQKSP